MLWATTMPTNLSQSSPAPASKTTSIMTVPMIDSGDSDLEHEARPAGVGDHQVAAAAEHEQRKASRLREFDGFGHFGNRRCLNEIAGRTSNLQGGERGQRHVFGDDHGRLPPLYTNEKRA